MTLRKRLLLTWVDSEISRKVFETQAMTMDVSLRGWFGRLPSLKLDQLDFMEEKPQFEDEDFEDSDEEEESEDFNPNYYEFDKDFFVSLKLGSLAITEIDAPLAECRFDAIGDIFEGLKAAHLLRYSMILKVQMAERAYFVSAISLNSVVMTDLVSKMLAEGHVAKSKV